MLDKNLPHPEERPQGASRRTRECSVHNEPQAERAFFGRRKGHPLRARQEQIFASALPRFQLDLGRPADDLTRLFGERVDEVRLEIGFGGGEHLIAQATAAPRTGFIGCEPFVNGVAKLLTAVVDQDIPNIRVHFGDAAELLTWIPQGALTGIDLLYPDPWPKRRHWKRRFVQRERIAEFARILRPGAEFRFASDSDDYATWTLALFLRSDQFAWMADRANDWRQPWPGHVRTRYEAKALAAGRAPTYLAFRRR